MATGQIVLAHWSAPERHLGVGEAPHVLQDQTLGEAPMGSLLYRRLLRRASRGHAGQTSG